MVDSLWSVDLPGEAHWDVCEDIKVFDDEGKLIYTGPRYMRCGRPECLQLVTHGQIALGSCVCGNRRLRPALMLSEQERLGLRRGAYVLCPWELVAVFPLKESCDESEA